MPLQPLLVQIVDIPDGIELQTVVVDPWEASVLLPIDEEEVIVESRRILPFASLRVMSCRAGARRVALDPDGASLADAAVLSEVAALVLDALFDLTVVMHFYCALEVATGPVLGRRPAERGFVERPGGGWELPSYARLLCALRVREQYDVGWIIIPPSPHRGHGPIDGAFLSLDGASHARIREKLSRIRFGHA